MRGLPGPVGHSWQLSPSVTLFARRPTDLPSRRSVSPTGEAVTG